MTYNKHEYTLSTGRKFYCYDGVIGMSGTVAMGVRDLPYGFDGDIEIEDWTDAERVEVADFMIFLWQQFKASRG